MSAVPTVGNYTAGTGIWDVGTINSGVTDTLTITALVSQTGSIQNVVEVTASGLPDLDSTPANGVIGEDDEAIANLTVPRPPTCPWPRRSSRPMELSGSR